MAIQVNSTGVSHAKSLIRQGKVDRESSWSFSAEDGNAILGDNNWSEYKKWFLAIDTEQNEETKARYKFPYGKNGKVYRRGVIAAKQRAAQQGYGNIVKAADELLSLIDKDKKNEEKSIEDFETPPVEATFFRTFEIAKRGIIDDENKIVEVSFSSEKPVDRWFGREILLHNRNSVDLSPIKEVGTVLINHDPNQRVAKPIKIWIDTVEKKGKALIQFGNTDIAQRAYQEVKEGLLRGVSVGYQVTEWMRLRENEKWNEFTGPAWIATKWQVYEFSLTPIPADPSVGVGRNREQFNKEGDIKMEKEIRKEQETKTPISEQKEQKAPPEPEAVKVEAINMERERVKEIVSLCKRHGFEDLAEQFIEKGTAVDEVRKIILDKLAEQNKPTGQVLYVEMGADEKEKVRDAVVDVMLVRAGLKNPYDNNVKLADGYREFANMTLFDIARECLKRAGIPSKGLSRMELVGRAFAHTTSDFPLILQNIANKALMEGFNAEPETWQEWCATGSVSDFKTNTLVRIGEFDDLEEIKEGAEYKQAQKIYEQQEQYSIATYGKLFTITRQTIINDDLNALAIIPKNMGEAARRKIADLAYSVLIDNPTMGDGKALFHSAHGNLASTGSEPTLDAIEKAIEAMRLQKDIGGKRRLNIKPQFVIVPIKYEISVLKALGTQYFSVNGSTLEGVKNIIANKYNLKVIADGRLDDAGNAWFLAGPKGKTVILFFLDGQQAPTLETQKGWSVDGVEYKVRIDCGAKAISWKALYKNPGA